MYPGKDYCAICNGVSEWDCSLQGGLLCNPGRKAEPQYIDFDTRAKAAGYVKLEPGQVVVGAKHLECARVWFLVFRKTRIDWTIEADHDADRAIAAAVNAAKENRDAR